MKKILGISLIAVFAISPMVAGATVTANTDIATTSYVQGAYEAATGITGDLSNLASSFTNGDKANLVAAVNATKTIADSASAQAGSGGIEVVTGTHDEGEGEDAHSVDEYAENLTEAVNQLNTNINGLQDGVNGAATITKLGAGASGYDINAKTLKVQGTNVLTAGGAAADTYSSTGSYASGSIGAELQSLSSSVGSALAASDITTGTANGTIAVDGTNVSVYGLGSAAYTDSTDYISAGKKVKAVQTWGAEDTSVVYVDLLAEPAVQPIEQGDGA